MGQAKQRGSFEVRQTVAIQRNKVFEAQIPKDSPLQKFRRQHGTQRLVTRLLMTGLIAISSKPSAAAEAAAAHLRADDGTKAIIKV